MRSEPTPVRMLDLAAERAALGPELERAVLAVLDSGRYVLGPEVEAFEHEFAAHHGARHAVGVASGTDALALALEAAGVGRGDVVVTSPFTFFASAAVVARLGARPVLADVELDTALIDPARVEELAAGARALLPVHLYGQLADMAALARIAERHGALLIEDAAQAHGATRDGLHVGALSEAACFSFYPTKNLGAAGDGGAVTTRSDELAERLRRLRDHGMSAKYRHAELGTNSRLAAIQAAVLRTKLPHLEAWNARRRAHAALYDEAFATSELVRPLAVADPAGAARHQYTVRVDAERREELQRALLAEGIETAIHYPIPVHLQEAARTWGHPPGSLPVAERLAREVLCLPIHPFLAPGEVERVAVRLLELAGKRAGAAAE